MTCTPSPFPLAVLAEASRISPWRRVSSDGICGDASHQATNSDHNPDARGIPHAVDISQSVPGAPFWQPGLGVFDAHRYARQKAADWVSGHGDARIKYMVIGQPAGPDIIFDPTVNLMWRQNGSFKTDHRSHLHVSFTVEAENSTAPFFQSEDDDVTPQDKADIINGVIQKLVTTNPDGTQSGILPSELKRYLNDPTWQRDFANVIAAHVKATP